MEGESGAAGLLIFTLLLMLELVFFMLWTISSGLKKHDADGNMKDTEKGLIKELRYVTGFFMKHGSIATLLFSMISFLLGLVYVFTMFRATTNFILERFTFIQEQSVILPEVMVTVGIIFMIILLNLLFGVLIPKRILSVLNTELTAEEQIISMVNEGHEQGVLQASEAEMIHNIFEFGDKEAKDIMINRSGIVAIDGDMLLSDAIEFMIAERNSRYPVYEENIDHIIGILHFKDAIRLQAVNKRLRGKVKSYPELIREAVFIPETRNLDNLFHHMQSTKTQIAIVVDEYGQTSGLLAMEDILEEIVGNIMDEYDEDEEYIEEKGDNVYEIEGLTPLDELEEELDIVFDDETFETLNGFLISKMEHIPAENEQFETDYKGYHFKVLSVENKMIKTVLVKKTLNS